MSAPSTPGSTAITAHSASEAGCDVCTSLLEQMNSTFNDVHRFIIANRDQRALNEGYLGDLGTLIQAQVIAHRKLVRHQQQHATAKGH